MPRPFGHVLPEYPVPVVNEREARAAAGILFAAALTAFLFVQLRGWYVPLEVFITFFFGDFFLRVLVDPRWAPSMVLGRLATAGQEPEFAGAPQKRFAWSLGLALSAVMFLLVVVLGVTGPWNLAVCVLCLTLLFLESSFGVCVGCVLYGRIFPGEARLCPGGACRLRRKHPVQAVGVAQAVFAVVAVVLAGVAVAVFAGRLP